MRTNLFIDMTVFLMMESCQSVAIHVRDVVKCFLPDRKFFVDMRTNLFIDMTVFLMNPC